MTTLKQIFEQDRVYNIEGFRIGYRSYPYKMIHIEPASNYGKAGMLLFFSIHSSYLCGLTYSTFATNYLVSRQFCEENTLEDVIGWIKEFYSEISNIINKCLIGTNKEEIHDT